MVKNRNITLQQQINTDEQWELILYNEGLTVVDVYSEWCGPCTAMLPNLKRVKRELAEYNLNLAIAKSDQISFLEQFRNKSEPTWMFLIGGKVVNMMFGANAPKLTRLIAEEIKKEAAVQAGIRDRTELVITNLPKEKEEEKSPEEIEDDALATGKSDKIIISDEDFIYRPF